MQPYWKFYQLIFEGKQMGSKLNSELKLRSFKWREVTHFYNKLSFNIKDLISDSIIVLLNTYLADKL